jgi:hypothetical protein
MGRYRLVLAVSILLMAAGLATAQTRRDTTVRRDEVTIQSREETASAPGQKKQSGEHVPVVIIVVGSLLSLGMFITSIVYLRRRRLMENTPTIPVRGAFIGMVELKGTAESPQPVRSFLAEADCVYYTYKIEEEWRRTRTETYKDSEGNTKTRQKTESGWRTVGEGKHEEPFFLKDDTGSIRIWPQGSALTGETSVNRTCGRSDPLYYGKGPHRSISDSTHRRRFKETIIPLHHELYVLGHARLREDAVELEVATDENQSTFLVSTKSEESMVAKYTWWYRVLTVLWIAAAAGTTAWVTHLKYGLSSGDAWKLFALVALGGAVVWVLSWLWVVYNSLCDLRHRLSQAWSNVDVQLQRRSDLIPNLVNIVKGLRDHEAETQTAIAALRSQANVRQPDDGAQPVGGTMMALKEAYPELVSNPAFLRLQRELTDTEDLIAMARDYYNGVVKSCRERATIVPDRYLASLASVKSVPYFEAQGFERRAQKVEMK